MFGATANSAQGTGLFGNTQAGAGGQQSGLFGSTQQSNTGQSTGLFGSTQSATTQSTGLFGNTQQSTTGQSTGLFGNNQQSNAGQTAGLFGNSQQSNTGQSTGLFGSTQPASTQSTGLFGNTQQSNTGQSTGLFGSSQQSNSGLFGNTQPNSNIQPTGFFASSQPSHAGQTTGLFGNIQSNPTQQTAGLFGSSQPASSIQSGGLFGKTQATATQPQSMLGSGLGTTAGQTGGFFQMGNAAQQQNANLTSNQVQLAGGMVAGTGAVDEAELLMQRLLVVKESWDPNSINCQFKHYFYNRVDPSEIDRYQRPLNENSYLWDEAVKENPSKGNMVPVMVTGFEGLRVRVNYISEQIEAYNNILTQVRSSLLKMGDSFDKKSVRLGEIRRKQSNIEQRMLRLNKNLQILKLYGQLLRPEEEVFKVRVADLSNAIHGNGAMKQQTIELQNTIERLISRNSMVSSAASGSGNGDNRPLERLDSLQYREITNVLEMQSSSLVYMSDSVARLNSEADSL